MRSTGNGRPGRLGRIAILASARDARRLRARRRRDRGRPHPELAARRRPAAPAALPPPPRAPARSPSSPLKRSPASPSISATATPASATRWAAASPRTTSASTSSTLPAKSVRTFYREDVAPDVPSHVRWDGTNAEGKPARNGKYSFRISPQAPAPAARKATATTALSLGFTLYGYTFPILGAHDYGGAAGRFGAGRSGHTHQGQDVMAACGVPLVAARGGTVQYSRWDDTAGNYIVIDGKGTPNDFVYMHLAEPSPLQEGETRPHRPADRHRRRHRRRLRLPPPLRDLGRPRLVRGRLPLRSPGRTRKVG